MRVLYSLLTHVLRPAALLVVGWRGLRNPEYRKGWDERFGLGRRLGSESSPTVWVHAVSLGEVTAAAPLVRALLARLPSTSLLLTTATPTGRARASALFGAAVVVRYLPYDTPGSMRRFLKRARPRLAIIMETELWPNLFHQCRRQGVPIVLANARLAPRSVRRYRRFGALFRDAFAGDVSVAAQSQEDADRFAALGARHGRIQVMGNLKFDLAVDPGLIARGRELRRNLWSSRPVWIAGSTHEGEEDAALDAHARLLTRVPQALLLLVPRHPERFQAVADLLNRRGCRFERRSSRNPVRVDCPVLLVDTVGELSTLYAAVDVAFVGGSLVPVGGHNLLEPAALGVPVITGPSQSNAREVAALLLQAGAALEVPDSAQLAEAVEELLVDEAKRRRIGDRALAVVAANRGSLARLLRLIEPRLAPGAAR